MPEQEPPPGVAAAAATDAPAASDEPAALDPRLRGVVVHALLEHAPPDRPPGPALLEDVLAELDLALTPEQAEEALDLAAAFSRTSLAARAAAAPRLRREATFDLPLDPDDPEAPLLNGRRRRARRGGRRDRARRRLEDRSRRRGRRPRGARRRPLRDPARPLRARGARGRRGARVRSPTSFLERPAEPAVAIYTQADLPAPVRGACAAAPRRCWPASSPSRSTRTPALRGLPGPRRPSARTRSS